MTHQQPSPRDYRTVNCHGESFDRGETFSELTLPGLQVIEEIRLCSGRMRWHKMAMR
jgi:hypothetical protein